MRKIKIICIGILSVFLFNVPCNAQNQIAQQASNTLKIANYSKGKLEIKVSPFGLNGNEITVGKVLKDGTIVFDWPEIDVKSFEGSEYFMEPIKRVVGMNFCNDKEIEESNKTAKAVVIVELSLFKKGRYVGSLYPATHEKMKDNGSLNRHTSLVLGSSLSWYYSDSDVVFKAKCSVNYELEDAYNFKEVTSYNIQLKKGWNLIKYTLVEKEDWKSKTNQGSLPKTITKTSIVDIPTNINWYVNYFGH